MLCLKLSKRDPVFLYDRPTGRKLGSIELNPNYDADEAYLCLDFPRNILILRAKAERSHYAKKISNTTERPVDPDRIPPPARRKPA